MAKSKAVCAAAVLLTVLAACGPRHRAQAVGVLAAVSGAPSLPPLPLPPSGSGPLVTPSPGSSTGKGGSGHGGAASPKPKPDRDPKPAPPTLSPGQRDYTAVIGPAGSPRCYWTIQGDGMSVYEMFVTTSYTGPSTDPTLGYDVQDGGGDVLQEGTIAINASSVEITSTDTVQHTSNYTEHLVFILAVPGVDANPRNDTPSVDMVIPFGSPPAAGTLKRVTCTD